MQTSKLECLALSPMFDTILISDAEGISKPDRQIFRRALERLHVNPAQAVFVGDHPEVDVAGARSAGMQAIWRRDPNVSRMVEADAVIDELGDLLPLLGLAPCIRRFTIDNDDQPGPQRGSRAGGPVAELAEHAETRTRPADIAHKSVPRTTQRKTENTGKTTLNP